MFSSKLHLRKRTPENGTNREEFLSLLVDEYLNSNSYDAKCQVLANLSNFGYDPVNYDFIRRVGVLDIFLYVLKNESDTTLLHFACAGICNLCIGILQFFLVPQQELKGPPEFYMRGMTHAVTQYVCRHTAVAMLPQEESLNYTNAEYILTNAGLKPIIAQLGSQHNETVADTITILISLYNKQTETDIKTAETIQHMNNIQKSDDKRLVNLASIFLNNVCN